MKSNYLNGYGKEICEHCNQKRTVEGYDGCIGELTGVMNACCGHGDDSSAYIQFDHSDYINEPNKFIIEGEDAIKYIKQKKIKKMENKKNEKYLALKIEDKNFAYELTNALNEGYVIESEKNGIYILIK